MCCLKFSNHLETVGRIRSSFLYLDLQSCLTALKHPHSLNPEVYLISFYKSIFYCKPFHHQVTIKLLNPSCVCMIYAILQFIIYCEDKHWLEKNDSTCIKLYFLMVGLFNLASLSCWCKLFDTLLSIHRRAHCLKHLIPNILNYHSCKYSFTTTIMYKRSHEKTNVDQVFIIFISKL